MQICANLSTTQEKELEKELNNLAIFYAKNQIEKKNKKEEIGKEERKVDNKKVKKEEKAKDLEKSPKK